MKFFSKLLLACGILMVFFGLAMAVTANSSIDTFFQFKDDLMLNDNLKDISEDEIETRYEEYLATEADSFKSTAVILFLVGVGFIAAAIGIVYLDRAFKRTEKGEYGDRE